MTGCWPRHFRFRWDEPDPEPPAPEAKGCLVCGGAVPCILHSAIEVERCPNCGEQANFNGAFCRECGQFAPGAQGGHMESKVKAFWLITPAAAGWARMGVGQPEPYVPLVIALSPDLDAVAARMTLDEVEALIRRAFEVRGGGA